VTTATARENLGVSGSGTAEGGTVGGGTVGDGTAGGGAAGGGTAGGGAADGWCSVEELTRWGFTHAPVVMANEAHSGLQRCIRTRQVGIRMVRAAHEAGVRRLAMEALPWRPADEPGPIREIPPVGGGYLAQPDMRALMTAALDLGWTLWAYEAHIEGRPGQDPAEWLTMEFTNWREREQARNLCRVLAAAPGEPLLVWTGNSHAATQPSEEWTPMGCHFPGLSGIDPFVIDQDVTVDFGHGHGTRDWVNELLDSLSEILAAHGGTAGILCGRGPESLARWPADAVIVSTDNALT